MKRSVKQVLLALCMITCLFSLSACSKEESIGVDPNEAASLQWEAVGVLEGVVSIPAEQMDLLIEMNRKEGSEAVAVGLESYLDALDELGAYISSGEATTIKTTDGYTITVDALFEKRHSTFTLGLNEEMTDIVLMSFTPVYTTSENIAKAGMNTLMGMGTVFLVLIFISLLIGCFKYINVWEAKRNNKNSGVNVPAPTKTVSVPVEADLTDDLELVAVITAAIAAAEGTGTDGLVVRSIRRAPASKWKNA